jgi:hypothetical protein
VYKRQVHPGGFERVASRNFAGLTTTRLHALGLPPVINRARIVAGRATRVFVPSPMAISAFSQRAAGTQHSLRLLMGYMRSLTYWTVRPHRLPPALLVAHRGLLLKELSELARLQELGSRAMRVGTESPFVLLVEEGTAELRIALLMDVPATASPLTADPPHLSEVRAVSLDLSDEWLVPGGVGNTRARRLEALSAVMQGRPDVGRKLLAGRKPWCQYALLRLPQVVAGAA